jgi:tRNA(Arg) A34 adenosine deaminase TadA
MDDRDQVNRRDFIATTAGAAGVATTLAGTAAFAQPAPVGPPPKELPAPAGFQDQKPIRKYWNRPLNEIVEINPADTAPELATEAGKERHKIYCYLLMKLIVRFWNGNKRGPLGSYPWRAKQTEPVSPAQPPQPTVRYRGDMIDNPDRARINWDRYLGHNIACVAVDGNGEIIDFDFNHNDFFRSTAEHAESRMVRRLFSLADIFDSWRTGQPSQGRSKAASLNDVTLYTSLESCAQCSGVMSLAQVKQIVYLQNDFTTYKIGNIMFNLANALPSGAPGAPLPIAGSDIGLSHFQTLNEAHLDFLAKIKEAKEKNDTSRAFYVSPDKTFVDFDQSITSFLCTDASREIFDDGGKQLDRIELKYPDYRPPSASAQTLTNAQCLKEARDFFAYADVEGYRGSPHKL